MQDFEAMPVRDSLELPGLIVARISGWIAHPSVLGAFSITLASSHNPSISM